MRLERRQPGAEPASLRAERMALGEEVATLRRAVEELKVLNEVATALAAAGNLEGVLHELVRRALAVVRAEQGVLTLVEEGDGAVSEAHTLVRTRAFSTAPEAFRPGDLLVGWVHRHRQPLRLDEPRTDSRFVAAAWPDAVRSVLAVPMLAGGRLVGVLTLYNKRGMAEEHGGRAAVFSPDDARLLTILAAQSAQVVDRARLAEERAEAEAERDRLLRAFGQTTAPAVVATIQGEGIEGLQERFGLTPQEAHVALLLSERKTNREVADALVISPHTAKRHTERVFEKLGVHVREAVRDRLAEDL